MPNLRPLLLSAPFLVLATLLAAQGTQVAFGNVKADPSLPVEVTADNLDVNQETGAAEFTGTVLVNQGEMKLSANRVLVIYNQEASGIDSLEATGDVLLVSGPDVAEAEKAEYTIESGTIVMTGNVLLSQGPNTITSEKMTVHLTNGTAQMSGRVKTILNPKEKN
ncbi:MAG: lipopolysaccharide transport periplasmic protein LptA [Paracoccaceae bacterium]